MNRDVQVTLSVHEPFGNTYTVALPLAESLWAQARRGIDVPRPDTDALTAALFCTDRYARTQVEDLRRSVANMIADGLVRVMGERDTVMGYRP